MNCPHAPKEPLSADDLLNGGVTGLAAGTLITIPNGEKKIEDIKAGDLVLGSVGNGFSRHYEATNVTSKSYRGPMLRIECQADEENEFRKFELRATPNHICFAHSSDDNHVEDSVVISAFDFYDIKTHEIEHVIHFKSGKITEASIDKVEEIAFRIARSQGGAEIRSFFGHINADMDDAGYRFMPAFELKVGMLVLTAREFILRYAFITSITKEQYDGLIYALDVPKVRNFAANGILVHDPTFLQL